MTEKSAKPENAENRGDSEKPSNPELKQLQDLFDLMVERGLDTVELKDEDGRIYLSRRTAGVWQSHVIAHPVAAPAARSASAAPAPAAEPEASQDAISAPLAGVFYRASSPNTPPFVKEGDAVEPGQTLCIIEAMKVMNEIKAEKRCRIAKIVAENSRPVSAGQPLFRVETA